MAQFPDKKTFEYFPESLSELQYLVISLIEIRLEFEVRPFQDCEWMLRVPMDKAAVLFECLEARKAVVIENKRRNRELVAEARIATDSAYET